MRRILQSNGLAQKWFPLLKLTLEKMLVQNILDNTRVLDCPDQANNLLPLVCNGRERSIREEERSAMSKSAPFRALQLHWLDSIHVSILQWNLFSSGAVQAELNNNWWAQISEGLRWFPGRRWWKDWEELPPITLLYPPPPPSPPNLNEPTVEHNSTPPG